MVGDPKFYLPNTTNTSSRGVFELMGEGQVQVVRNHPAWKNAMNGIISMRDTDIPMNLALYLAESEQRAAVLLADVYVDDNNLCQYALALLVESLPNASTDCVETCIRNVQSVATRGLSHYMKESFDEQLSSVAASSGFIPTLTKMPAALETEERLHRVLDDCFIGLGDRMDMRFAKTPSFVCECNSSKVLRAISLLPKL